ncbi:hypothetical protein EV363DRAFT_850359 [Boletus edulis]|nr:hypothetical protein EV363DRAFT_850359 [Boletus edulis]
MTVVHCVVCFYGRLVILLQSVVAARLTLSVVRGCGTSWRRFLITHKRRLLSSEPFSDQRSMRLLCRPVEGQRRVANCWIGHHSIVTSVREYPVSYVQINYPRPFKSRKMVRLMWTSPPVLSSEPTFHVKC